ncbi:MFS transporter [Corynebacterium sphenisci]|uniref:MFS transporter n=1 Tax=Corynebacterium sphenisci TaxID=191493 RepID=UPI0026DFA279|nr:MFS transporter [Corynebacterium sphenisci]MDO5730501.1 MFS transporter [Corynebacterium sphenisci]
MGEPATRTPWAAVAALGVGIFTMTTLEQLPIGVLTLVSSGLGVAEGVVGLGVTVPGLLAGATAAVTPRLAGRADRRRVLAGALAAAAASAAASALAPGAATFLASRIIVGFAIGVFWALLGATVARIAAPGDVPRALATAFSGSAAAVVLGVPLTTWLGAWLGWRGAFAAGAGFAALVAVAVLALVPAGAAPAPAGGGGAARAWARPGVRFGVVFTLLLVTAHFTAYTYASPILQELAGVDVTGVGAMLLLFGAAGIAGNFAAGPLLRRSRRLAVTVLPPGLLAGMGLLAAGHGPAAAAAAMIVWGLFGGAVSVISQGWVLGAAGEFAEPASGLNSAAFNVGIAAGSAAGGLVHAGLPGAPGALGAGGPAAVLAVAAAGMALTGALAALGARRRA